MGFVRKEAVIEMLRTNSKNCRLRERQLREKLIAEIEAAPEEAVVSREVFEQFRWERDIAMEQLKEHGIAFGAKKEEA